MNRLCASSSVLPQSCPGGCGDGVTVLGLVWSVDVTVLGLVGGAPGASVEP